jgi:hypothetical protein
MYITADFLVIWSLTVLVLRPPRIKVPLRDADSAFDRRAPLVGRKTIEASPDHSGSPVAHRRGCEIISSSEHLLFDAKGPPGRQA